MIVWPNNGVKGPNTCGVLILMIKINESFDATIEIPKKGKNDLIMSNNASIVILYIQLFVYSNV